MVKILGYIAAAVLAVAAFALFMLPFVVLNGWVLSWLWLWFLVPLGLPAIGLAHSIGITGFVGFLTKQYDGKSEEGNYEKLAYAVMAPFIALGVGYIVHSFM